MIPDPFPPHMRPAVPADRPPRPLVARAAALAAMSLVVAVVLAQLAPHVATWLCTVTTSNSDACFGPMSPATITEKWN